MPEINRGDYCIIANNMGSAFMAGDRVLVEDISPDPSRPAYKYVVLSARDQKRYLLSDADLTSASPAIQKPVDGQPVPQAGTRKQKEPKKISTLTKVLVGILLLILFAGGGFLAGRLTSKQKTVVRTVVQKSSTPTTPNSTPASSSTVNPSSTSATTPNASQPVSQIGPKPDLSKPNPNAPGYQHASQGNPITKAQYDLLKGGMSSAEIGAALGESYQANFLESIDASGRKVDDYDWAIKDDPQGYVKAKLVDDKLVEKSWNPSTGEPSWEVY